LVAAGRFVSELEKLPPKVSDTAVATVGKLTVTPNGANVIPESVKMIVDIRDIHEDTRNQLIELVQDRAETIAVDRNIGVTASVTSRVKPIPIDDTYKNELQDILTDMSIEPMELPRGEGHDSMTIRGEHGDAMIFARSNDASSHSPEDW